MKFENSSHLVTIEKCIELYESDVAVTFDEGKHVTFTLEADE